MTRLMIKPCQFLFYVGQVTSAWSNVDLFQQFTEASKDSCSTAHNSAVKRQRTCDLVVTDDEELENYLAHEDFQRFSDRQFQSFSDNSMVDDTWNSDNCSTTDQKDIGRSAFQQRVVSELVPAGRCSTQKKLCKAASAEVEIAQTIARSRLRDFNLNVGGSRASLVYHRNCTDYESDAGHDVFKTVGPSTFPSTASSEQELDTCTET